MSEQRLDLSQYPEVDRGDCFDFPHSTAQDYMALRDEALRAQASEDALRERVRVLEAVAGTALHAIDEMRSDYGVTRGIENAQHHLRNALDGGKGEG